MSDVDPNYRYNINNTKSQVEVRFVETKLCEVCGQVCRHTGTCPNCYCEGCVGSDDFIVQE